MKKKALSPKQQRFVFEYLKDQNGKQAATRAGYSKKTAESQASRLLRNAKVKQLLAAKFQRIEDKAVVDAAYVIRGLKEVAERCLEHKPVMEFDHEEKEMVQKTVFTRDSETGNSKQVGVYEFDSAGANRSLELLGKHLKMFTERMELKVSGNLSDKLQSARRRLAGDGPPVEVLAGANGHNGAHTNGIEGTD